MQRDRELANGFQDADIEMAGLAEAGSRAAQLEKLGLCTHGWTNGSACLDCGTVAESAEALRIEGRNRLLG